MNTKSQTACPARFLVGVCLAITSLLLNSSVHGQTLPTIIIEPVSQSSAVGGIIQFEVSASGAGTLVYQWRKNTTNMVNGGNIGGATNPTLTVSSITITDQANYTCWITNDFGSVTSAVATLAVIVAPGIVIQPQSVNKTVGSATTFSVLASGTSPFFYQWYKDSVAISNATLNAYTLAGLFLSDAGTYSVRVSNPAGTIPSSNAVLNVGYGPGIVQPPLSGSNYLGETAFFGCTVSGSSPMSFQWRFNNVPLVGQTNSTLTLTNLLESDFGFYSVSATNAFGGTVSSDAQLRLLLKWTMTGEMNINRSYHTATLLQNGTVLVVGGYGSNSVVLSSTELFDPDNGTWTVTGELTNTRVAHTATLLQDGRVLVSGGFTSGNSAVENTDLYDPKSGTWTTTGSMIAARGSHTATLLPNGKVLVAGGQGGNTSLLSAELYDPATGTWTNTGPLHFARYIHTAVLLPNGKVLVTGGTSTSLDRYLSSAELYDPTTGLWTTTGNLNIGRYLHTATLLPNGRVLLTGGYNSSYFSGVELYDPNTGIWLATNSMITARGGHTANLLPNGRVIVVGGWGSSYTSITELHDSNTGTWMLTNPLNTHRSDHTATLLPNGKVLVAGGWGGDALASAELYDLAAGTLGAVTLTNQTKLPSGAFQFGFTNIPIPGATFTAFATTNLTQPLSNWAKLGGVTDLLPGQFQFTDLEATNSARRFYRVRSP